MSSSDRKNRSSPADVARAEANDPRIEPIFPSASFEVSEDVSVSKWNSPTPAFHEDEADDMELNEVDRATERCDTIPDAKSQSSSGSRSSRNGSRQMTMTEDCFEGNDPNDSDDDQVASGPSTLTFGTASENISRHVQHTAAAGDDCDDEAMSRTTLSDFDDTESPYASYGEDMILSGSSSPSSIRSTQKSQYSSPSFAEEEEVAARRGVQLRSTFRKLLRTFCRL
ncbi:hypothetical protein BC829DRAFT_409115 [Chytridium lagenaria]|nr:hypothetical protein BC829DRAFT_409115 [Chytridium lagenaria]